MIWKKKKIAISNSSKSLIAVPIPRAQIRIFMSAPAISGIDTFKDMCEEIKGNTAFFSTVNSKDLTLKKFVGIVNGLGSTSLGLNYNCDVMQTKIDYFWDQGYFNYNKETIEIPQHSIFDYMQQPALDRSDIWLIEAENGEYGSMQDHFHSPCTVKQ